MKYLSMTLVALSFSLSGLAASRNTGGDAPIVPSPNVLTHVRGAGIGVLYAPSEADDAAYRASIAALTGGTVDYFDARVATPTLATLNTYDAVYVWVNFAMFDPIAFGDVLADYVDGGGVVILGAFCTFTSGNSLAGRIMTAGYSPVTSPAGTNHFLSSNYNGDGATCIHDGVTTYECTFRDVLVTQGGGTVDGTFVDGEIAHAYNTDFNVFYSNGNGALALGCTGQWPELIANMVICSQGAQIPTLGTYGLLALILALGLGAFYMRRSRT